MARVGLGLSGGVDSAVAALLLQRAGHEVIAFSLCFGPQGQATALAGQAAAKDLKLEHHIINVDDQFNNLVLEPVIRSYAEGHTPNPCVLCNARIKIPLLWRAAQAQGCQYLATGHYARIAYKPEGVFLSEARDFRKSQAYFLARLDPLLLPRLLFPLADYLKQEVKSLACCAGLRSFLRKESQDVCFLPAGGWDELMLAHRAVRPGVFKDENGAVLGEHKGLHNFTIGRRRGLGLALGYPAYVLALDGNTASVTVGPEQSLWRESFWVHEPVWYSQPKLSQPLEVRIRYNQKNFPARLEEQDGFWQVICADPIRAVAPGQLAVFFLDDLVIGSAWILSF